MTLLFERHIERRVEAELTRFGLQLAGGIRLDASGELFADLRPSDPRFREPASGLYWQVSAPAGTLRSRSLWDSELPESPATGSSEWESRKIAGPFDQELLIVERLVQPDRRGAAVLVQLGSDRKSLRAASEEFGRELAMFLTLLWAILSAAAWLQVQLGLRPLRRVREELATLQSNPSARLTATHALEIEPLANAINTLAEAREADLTRARRRASDLAHALKTPLAALTAQTRRARDAGATEAADGLDRAIASAAGAVESELARTRVATIRTGPAARTAPHRLIEALVGVLEHTEFGAVLVFQVDIPDDLTVPVAAEDLSEMLGALLENAARFARRRVRVSGATGSDVSLSIEDDGPGLDLSRMEVLLAPDRRLDESGAGSGRGILIARDFAEMTNGRISMRRSELGGLQVDVSWPVRAPTPVSAGRSASQGDGAQCHEDRRD